jgi:hypothetical protein
MTARWQLPYLILAKTPLTTMTQSWNTVTDSAVTRYTTTYLPPTVPTVYRHLRVSPPLLPPRRLYEFFILDWNVQFRNELEYFCCVQDTPAILFKFHELEARPKVFEETPEWAKRVKPFDEIFTYPIKTVKR